MLKTQRVVIVGIAVTNKDGKQYKNVYARDIDDSHIESNGFYFDGYKTYNFFVPFSMITELGQEVTICYANGKYEYLQL